MYVFSWDSNVLIVIYRFLRIGPRIISARRDFPCSFTRLQSAIPLDHVHSPFLARGTVQKRSSGARTLKWRPICPAPRASHPPRAFLLPDSIMTSESSQFTGEIQSLSHTFASMIVISARTAVYTHPHPPKTAVRAHSLHRNNNRLIQW